MLLGLVQFASRSDYLGTAGSPPRRRRAAAQAHAGRCSSASPIAVVGAVASLLFARVIRRPSTTLALGLFVGAGRARRRASSATCCSSQADTRRAQARRRHHRLLLLRRAVLGRLRAAGARRSTCSRSTTPTAPGSAAVRRRRASGLVVPVRSTRSSSSCSRRSSPWIWVRLGRRNLDPSAPMKFGLGLVLLGVGFLVMMLRRAATCRRAARCCRPGCS